MVSPATDSESAAMNIPLCAFTSGSARFHHDLDRSGSTFARGGLYRAGSAAGMNGDAKSSTKLASRRRLPRCVRFPIDLPG